MNYDRLVREHKDAVYRQLLRVCGNHDDAEDALVEALLSAYRASEQLSDESNFRAWLSMIGRRVCGRIKRKAALMPIVSLSELLDSGMSDPKSDAPSPELEAMQRETQSCVQQAFGKLPALYMEVYRLREIEQVSAEEVAKRLDLTVPAVKSRLHRSRALVRQYLDEGLCS